MRERCASAAELILNRIGVIGSGIQETEGFSGFFVSRYDRL
jgi:hypothetical protein